jgi:hypothetical protein
MTEADWMGCESPVTLLSHLGPDCPERKGRLFACACCRRIWKLLPLSCRRVVQLTERWIEGRLHDAEFRQLCEIARGTGGMCGRLLDLVWAAATYPFLWNHPFTIRRGQWTAESELALHPSPAGAAIRAAQARCLHLVDLAKREAAYRAEQANQACLLRHILGNPFQPWAVVSSWPVTVVQLAQSLYDGLDCTFALHDALLDAGLVEFAAHFKQEAWHPKGCWLLDLILGKS